LPGFNVDPEFNFETPKIPVVHVETEMFECDVYELYEMPSAMVLDILGAEGPLQMELMAHLFRMAVVNPSDLAKLDILSFNELASAMFQWYRKSNIKINPGSTVRKPRTLQEILESAIEVLEEVRDGSEENKPKVPKAFNDPGDDISPIR
jgi:hypothetical protein